MSRVCQDAKQTSDCFYEESRGKKKRGMKSEDIRSGAVSASSEVAHCRDHVLFRSLLKFLADCCSYPHGDDVGDDGVGAPAGKVKIVPQFGLKKTYFMVHMYMIKVGKMVEVSVVGVEMMCVVEIVRYRYVNGTCNGREHLWRGGKIRDVLQ